MYSKSISIQKTENVQPLLILHQLELRKAILDEHVLNIIFSDNFKISASILVRKSSTKH